MRRQVVRVMIAVALLVNLQGCAAVALTLLSAGASVGGSAGIDYTMNGAPHEAKDRARPRRTHARDGIHGGRGAAVEAGASAGDRVGQYAEPVRLALTGE